MSINIFFLFFSDQRSDSAHARAYSRLLLFTPSQIRRYHPRIHLLRQHPQSGPAVHGHSICEHIFAIKNKNKALPNFENSISVLHGISCDRTGGAA